MNAAVATVDSHCLHWPTKWHLSSSPLLSALCLYWPHLLCNLMHLHPPCQVTETMSHCLLLLLGQKNCCPPPLKVVVDHPAANQADGDGDPWQVDNWLPPSEVAVNYPLLLPATHQQKSFPSLLVIVNCIATNKADVMVVVVDATQPLLVWQPMITAFLQHHASADNTLLSVMSCKDGTQDVCTVNKVHK